MSERPDYDAQADELVAQGIELPCLRCGAPVRPALTTIRQWLSNNRESLRQRKAPQQADEVVCCEACLPAWRKQCAEAMVRDHEARMAMLVVERAAARKSRRPGGDDGDF